MQAEGVTKMFFQLRVPVSEMREWEPVRIIGFFSGIAQAIAAAEGNQVALDNAVKWLQEAQEPREEAQK